MRKNLLLLLIPGLLLGGCAFKSRFLTDDFKTADAYFSGLALGGLEIIDERPEGERGELKVEAGTLKGKKGSAHPALSGEHRGEIETAIRSHLGSSGQTVSMKAFVTKGEKAFKASWGGDQEKVRFAVRLEYYDGELKRQIKTSGESSLEVNSATSSDDYLEKVYRKAIRSAVHESFASLKEYYEGK